MLNLGEQGRDRQEGSQKVSHLSALERMKGGIKKGEEHPADVYSHKTRCGHGWWIGLIRQTLTVKMINYGRQGDWGTQVKEEVTQRFQRWGKMREARQVDWKLQPFLEGWQLKWWGEEGPGEKTPLEIRVLRGQPTCPPYKVPQLSESHGIFGSRVSGTCSQRYCQMSPHAPAVSSTLKWKF